MPITFDSGSIMFVSGQMAMDRRCCGKNCCTSSQGGIINSGSYGWQPAPAADGTSIHGTFRFEDSQNCGGNNGGAQSGYARCRVSFSVAMKVSYRLAGKTERQNSGYDNSWIVRDGAEKVRIGATNEGLGCQMQNHEQTNQETVPAGRHTFEFHSATNDGLYHVGMTHTFLVDWVPA